VQKIVSLEGAWGGGKTTILKALLARDEKVFGSIVPDIYEMKGRETYSPRKNPKEFTELFLQLKDQQYQKAHTSEPGIAFFDRVFFAPIVLRRFFDLEVPGAFYDLARTVNIYPKVFLVAPIPLQQHKDGWPRKFFSYEESLRYHALTREVILDLNYEVCEVPYLPSAEERATFIQTALKPVRNND
jgi:predicted ATPase